MTSREEALSHLQAAYGVMARWFEDQGGRGVELADAIDHTAAAIRNLGEEPKRLHNPEAAPHAPRMSRAEIDEQNMATLRAIQRQAEK